MLRKHCPNYYMLKMYRKAVTLIQVIHFLGACGFRPVTRINDPAGCICVLLFTSIEGFDGCRAAHKHTAC